MDIRYKSFVPRSKQDHRFDQLLQASSSVSKPSYDFSYNKSPTNTDYSNFSQKSPTQSLNNRKRVNVVTFTPDDSNELVTRKLSPNVDNVPDSPTNDSYKGCGNGKIPSILRTSRIASSKSDASLDSIVDSASKMMAAKRKAAKEVTDIGPNGDEHKTKRSNIISSADVNQKRAVSPEILRSDSELPSFLTCKSRPLINSKKTKVTYNHRPWQDCLDEDDEFDNQYRLKSENIVYRSNSDPVNTSVVAQLYDFDNNNDDDIDCTRSTIARHKNLPKSKSDTSYIYQSRSIKNSLNNDAKNQPQRQNYAVLENVKEAYECQERGEAQDLLDDVEYLIEGLKDNLPASTRTLSIITLTGKCLLKSFRELLKAHGLLGKIFRYLDDAYLNESVAMCTAALFLVFSRDKQPRIFDDNSLSLLLKLPRISKNQTKQSKENERVRDKIRLMLNKFHQSNKDNHKAPEFESNKPANKTASFPRPCNCCRHLKLDNNITTEDLVVECLLQFSSRKCADWFKSLLRKQHGLDLICDQVTASVEYLGADLGPQSLDEFVMDRLYRLFNYMRFFEHMTFQNRDNQSYLVDYCDAMLIDTLLRCLKLCAANLSYQSNGSPEKKLIQACLLANLRLLANISHDNEYTSNLLGSCSGLLKLIFSCLLHLPRFMSSGKRFDLSVLALALLINLVEHCTDNRRRMAHVSISRKRIACLGKCGQLTRQSNPGVNMNNNNTAKSSDKSMEFSFEDEVEDEDMDIEDDDDDDADGYCNQYDNIDCESTSTKINVLEALVKLFLRHDDRAKNNTLIEGEEETPIETTDEVDINTNGDIDSDPKWRLVAEKGLSRKTRSNKVRGGHNVRDKIMNLSDSEEDEEDGSSDEGADVEFMISSKEEEAELQKKLSAAGQHMQDSVVSAYTALLLGCIIKSSQHYMERIRQHLPSGKFKILAFVLAKFLSILSLTSGMSHTGEASILEIVRVLEAQDQVCVSHNKEDVSARMSGRALCRQSKEGEEDNEDGGSDGDDVECGSVISD